MNKKETTRAIYKALESGNPESVGKYASDDFVFSGPIPEPINFEKWVGLQKQVRTAFPDWSFNLSDVQETENGTRTTLQITGTHTGDLDLSALGLPVVKATGKSVKLPVEHVDITFKGDKVSKFHGDVPAGGGLPGIFKQLGVEMPKITG